MVFSRVGIENEFWLHEPDGKPFDLFSLVGEGRELAPGIVIKTDFRKKQGEFVLDPFSPEEIDTKLLEGCAFLRKLVPLGVEFLFTGADPFGFFPAWDEAVPKSRYNALKQSAFRECGEAGPAGLLRTGTFAALHIHLPVEPFSEEGVLLANYFNMLGPALAIALSNPWPSRRLALCWKDWCSPKRLPAPVWFSSSRQAQDFVLSIPQFVRSDGNGSWESYLGSAQGFVPQHLGTIYSYARFRPDLGTIELRSIDSTPPLAVRHVVMLILRIAESVLRTKGSDLPRLSDAEWWGLMDSQDLLRSQQLLREFFV